VQTQAAPQSLKSILETPAQTRLQQQPSAGLRVWETRTSFCVTNLPKRFCARNFAALEEAGCRTNAADDGASRLGRPLLSHPGCRSGCVRRPSSTSTPLPALAGGLLGSPARDGCQRLGRVVLHGLGPSQSPGSDAPAPEGSPALPPAPRSTSPSPPITPRPAVPAQLSGSGRAHAARRGDPLR